MPHTKADYSKTVIYKIQHREIDELLYVGSTTDFTRRKKQHQKMCNNVDGKQYNTKIYKNIRDNGGWDMFNMVIVKEFPCQNKYEAFMEEDRCMIEMKANMNSFRAYQTHEEYEECKKQYRIKYKDKIAERDKQKMTCECGCVIRRCGLAIHKRTKKHQKYLLDNQ